ncbi:MAG: UDP-N-acetylglucosamine 2-epimerase (hydrolyzing) [Myxococcales bacterium]|nr:UDP-N-acetylglucosamine 2-epimerase (hydrolyzing) [Myxococcales bacterium]
MSDVRRVGVVSSARSDFGLLLPLLHAITADQTLELLLLATGMHFSPAAGETIEEVRRAGLGGALVEIAPRSASAGDSEHAAATRAFADEVAGFGALYASPRTPQVVVILGDRYDALPAAIAALPFNIALAHLSGGEITEGVIDDSIRHALTKLSHLHFPAHERAAARIRSMGEEPWRVEAVGEPGLDALATLVQRPRAEVFAGYQLDPSAPLSLLTYHPETLAGVPPARGVAELLAAAEQLDTQVVATYPNGEPGSAQIVAALEAFCAARPSRRKLHASLGRAAYLELLAVADCMVGNSSSGLIEAPSLGLPVVNIGDRQRGRLRASNVADVSHDRAAIAGAWREALARDRAALRAERNPYGDGNASKRIVARLRDTPLDARLLRKRFVQVHA